MFFFAADNLDIVFTLTSNGQTITPDPYNVVVSIYLDGILQTVKYIKKMFTGILFTNLVDFDMKYGHRNDVNGYANAIKTFDNSIPEIIELLGNEDVLFITADHGCDPTTPGTDHSREYVPLLVYGKNLNRPCSLGIRQSFADVGATITEIFGLKPLCYGQSFFKDLF